MHQALQMRFIYTRVWDMHLQILQATITLQKRQLMLGRRQLDSSIGIFRNYLLTRSSAEAFKDISKHMGFKELRMLFHKTSDMLNSSYYSNALLPIYYILI